MQANILEGRTFQKGSHLREHALDVALLGVKRCNRRTAAGTAQSRDGQLMFFDDLQNTEVGQSTRAATAERQVKLSLFFIHILFFVS